MLPDELDLAIAERFGIDPMAIREWPVALFQRVEAHILAESRGAKRKRVDDDANASIQRALGDGWE